MISAKEAAKIRNKSSFQYGYDVPQIDFDELEQKIISAANNGASCIFLGRTINEKDRNTLRESGYKVNKYFKFIDGKYVFVI